MRRAIRRAALGVLVVVPLACGDIGGLTKSTFITQGDAICQRLTAASSKVTQPTTEQDVAVYLDKVLTLADRAKADMAKLDPPADGQRVKDALLSSLDDTIANARQARTAAAKGDMQAVQDRLTQAGQAAARAQAQAKAYGFKECATP